MLLYTIEKGLLKEVLVDGEVVAVIPPVSLQDFKIEDVLGYLRVWTALRGPQAPVSSVAKGPETKPIVELVHKPTEVVEQPQELEKVKSNYKNLTDTEKAQYYHKPIDIKDKTAHKHIKKEAVEFVFNKIKDGSSFVRGQIINDPKWATWETNPKHPNLYALLYVVWNNKGLLQKAGTRTVSRVGVPAYKFVWNQDRFKEYLIKLGAGITPQDISEYFWVPEDYAREKLEALNEKFLTKHARREEYMVKNKTLFIKREFETKAPAHISKSEPKPFEWPAVDSFHFIKEAIQCTSCRHNYRHAYVSGKIYLCGGCYEKIGGNQSHGKDATIRKD